MAWESDGRTSSTEWRKTRARILSRDRRTCQIRGPECTIAATEVDHITPVAFGGTDHDRNLQAVCVPCHAAKTRRESAEGRRRNARRRPNQPPHPGLA